MTHTSLSVDASLGKPSLSTPTSVEVPPMSATMAFLSPDNHMAPLMLLVAPEEKVYTGKSMVRVELELRKRHFVSHSRMGVTQRDEDGNK